MTPSFIGRMAVMLPGRAPEHPLGLVADRADLAGHRVQRHDRGLAQDDALVLDVYERVGGAEIDSDVAALCQRGKTHLFAPPGLSAAPALTPARPGATLAGSMLHEGPFATVTAAIHDIAAGRLVIVTDDEARENEGDLIMAAAQRHARRRST
jgi:hypothetical protein